MMRVVRGLCAPLLLAFPLGVAHGVETRTLSNPPTTLLDGRSSGVAVTERGRLFLGPRVARLDGSGGATAGIAHVWSLARGHGGQVYAGTGPEGQVLEFSPAGRAHVLYTVEEPMVTALTVLGDGTLLAGTAPKGRIYRIRGTGQGTLFCETGARYVWALTVAPDGRVLAATGESGAILEIDDSGNARPFFVAEEAHIVTITAQADGELLAGGAGRGLLYRIDRDGRATVLHDNELPEARAIAARDGHVFAAWVAPPEPTPRRPAVRIQVPAGGAADTVGELSDEEGSQLEGVIEGLPVRPERAPAALRGRVMRIDRDGTAVELWSSRTEAPFAMMVDGRGRLVFGTGEPARLYRVEADGDVALLAEFEEGQASTVLPMETWVALGTSNPAGIYRLDREPPTSGWYESPPLDAGGPARWGSASWRLEGGSSAIELSTRSGNSARPDGTWSDWSPPLTDSAGSPLVNPDGRYLQWRARLFGREATERGVAAVAFSLTPYNRAPRLLDLRVDDDVTAVATELALSASVSDPDLDPLTVEVQLRDAAGRWSTVARSAVVEPTRLGSWPEARLSWDTRDVVEGRYLLRGLASDANANDPGEAKREPGSSLIEVVVDRTEPGLAVKRLPDGSIEALATDERSGVRRLEILDAAGRPLGRVLPADGVCDSEQERFVVRAEFLEGATELRVTDAAGNVHVAPIPAAPGG